MEFNTESNITEIHNNDVITGNYLLEVTRNDGSTEKYEYPMESFTQRYWEVIMSSCTYSYDPQPDLTYRSYNSSSTSMQTQEFDVRRNTSINRPYGIVLGSGSAAVTLDDYRLEAEIPTAELERSTTDGTFERSNRTCTFNRTFENISGASVTVEEMGIKGTHNAETSETSMMLLTRDVFSPITLADGEFISVSVQLSWAGTDFQYNWDGIMYTMWADAEPSITILRTDGFNASSAAGNALYPYVQFPYPHTDTTGILVGDNDTAYGTQQRHINNQIGNGSSAGELIYGSFNIKPVYNDGSKVYFQMQRAFTNFSGADVTVREIGWFGGGSSIGYLQWAKILPTPVTISNGETHIFRIIFNTSL